MIKTTFHIKLLNHFKFQVTVYPCFKWVHCHNSMMHPQVVDGTVNIMHKHLWTANKGSSPSLWLGLGPTTSHHKELNLDKFF